MKREVKQPRLHIKARVSGFRSGLGDDSPVKDPEKGVTNFCATNQGCKISLDDCAEVVALGDRDCYLNEDDVGNLHLQKMLVVIDEDDGGNLHP